MLETTNIRLPSCFPPHCTQHSRGSSSLQSSSPAPSPPGDDDDDGNGNDDGDGNYDDVDDLVEEGGLPVARVEVVAVDMITGHGTGHRDGGVVFRAELRRAWVLSSFPQLYCTALYCIVLYCTVH